MNADVDARIVTSIVAMVVLVQRDVGQLVEKLDRHFKVFEPEEFIYRQYLNVTRSPPDTTHMPVTLDQRAKVRLNVIMVDVHGLAKWETGNFRKEMETTLSDRCIRTGREGLCTIKMNAMGTFIRVKPIADL